MSKMNTENQTLFRMIDIVLPDSTNHYGTLFAGNVVALIVRAAFLGATQFSKQKVVLAGIDQIDCLLPIKLGSIVELVAQVINTGKSSINIKVELFSKNSNFDGGELAAKGYLNLAAVDENGKPIQIKSHIALSDFEKSEAAYVKKLKEFKLQNKLRE